MTLTTNLKDISKHSMIYVAGWGIAAVIRLGLLPVFTRYLDQTEYGTLAVLDSAVEILRILCALGFGAAITRFYSESEDPGYRSDVLATGAGFTLLLIVMFGLVIFPFSQPLSHFILGGQAQVTFFQLSFATVLVNLLRSVADSYLTANKLSVSYITINTVQVICQAALNLYLVVVLKSGVHGMLVGNLVVTAAFSIGLYLFMVWRNGIRIRKDLILPMLKYGLPLVPTIWAVAATHNMDRFFIRHYETLEAVGQYSLAYQFPFMLNAVFMNSFSRIWENSSIYEIARSPDAAYQYGRICTYFMAVLGFALFALSMLSDIIVSVFAAPSYFGAHRYIPIIALGVWGYSLHTFLRVGVMLSKKTYLLTFNYVLSFFINVVCNFLLIPAWGAMGAAWATVITYFGFSLGGYLIYRSCYPMKLEWGRLAKILLLGVALVLLRQTMDISSTGYSLLVGAILVALFPALLVFCMGFLTGNEKKRVREWVQSVRDPLAGTRV